MVLLGQPYERSAYLSFRVGSTAQWHNQGSRILSSTNEKGPTTPSRWCSVPLWPQCGPNDSSMVRGLSVRCQVGCYRGVAHLEHFPISKSSVARGWEQFLHLSTPEAEANHI